MFLRLFVIAVAVFCLSSCGYLSKDGAVENSILTRIKAYEDQGFTYEVVDTGFFNIAVLKKTNEYGRPGAINFYLEGDGNAWLTRYQVSSDPTPLASLVVDMAYMDEAEHTVYIARPCQLLIQSHKKNCFSKYWTSHRYSFEVIDSLDNAISHVKDKIGIKNKIGLIGYSGGGVVASLISVIREDIGWLVTVATNLSHKAWTESHKVSPLYGSLNIEDYIEDFANVKQLHLIGEHDDVVGIMHVTEILHRFSPQASPVVIAEYDHRCCWGKEWNEMLRLINKYFGF